MQSSERTTIVADACARGVFRRLHTPYAGTTVVARVIVVVRCEDSTHPTRYARTKKQHREECHFSAVLFLLPAANHCVASVLRYPTNDRKS